MLSEKSLARSCANVRARFSRIRIGCATRDRNGPGGREVRCEDPQPSPMYRRHGFAVDRVAAAIATSACDNNNGVGSSVDGARRGGVRDRLTRSHQLDSARRVQLSRPGFSPSFDRHRHRERCVAVDERRDVHAARRDDRRRSVHHGSVAAAELAVRIDVILAGTTRSFAMHPTFSCPGIPVVTPHAMRATVNLVDRARPRAVGELDGRHPLIPTAAATSARRLSSPVRCSAPPAGFSELPKLTIALARSPFTIRRGRQPGGRDDRGAMKTLAIAHVAWLSSPCRPPHRTPSSRHHTTSC